MAVRLTVGLTQSYLGLTVLCLPIDKANQVADAALLGQITDHRLASRRPTADAARFSSTQQVQQAAYTEQSLYSNDVACVTGTENDQCK